MTISLIDSEHYPESVLAGVRAQVCVCVCVCEPGSVNDWKKHGDISVNRNIFFRAIESFVKGFAFFAFF